MLQSETKRSRFSRPGWMKSQQYEYWLALQVLLSSLGMAIGAGRAAAEAEPVIARVERMIEENFILKKIIVAAEDGARLLAVTDA